MSGIPGTLANRWTWQPSSNNGCRMSIRCRGHGTYVLVTNVPVQEARVTWHFGDRSGLHTRFQGSGRPQANIMVWHLDREKRAESFTVEFRVQGDRRVPEIRCELYTSPPGGSRPRGPGWAPEDAGRHHR